MKTVEAAERRQLSIGVKLYSSRKKMGKYFTVIPGKKNWTSKNTGEGRNGKEEKEEVVRGKEKNDRSKNTTK